MDLHARVLVSFVEKGKSIRSYFPLQLERSTIVLFPLNWTIVHPLTEESPLWNKTQKDLENLDAEFIVVLKGYDDTFSQEVNSIYSYRGDEIVFGAKFDVMYETEVSGSTLLHINRLNSFSRVPYQ